MNKVTLNMHVEAHNLVSNNAQRVMAPVFKHERIECDSGGYMERRATNVEGILGAVHLGRGTLEDAAQTASWKPPDEAEGRAPSKKRASIFATRLRPQKKVGVLSTAWFAEVVCGGVRSYVWCATAA